jgi:hypothetical protein
MSERVCCGSRLDTQIRRRSSEENIGPFPNYHTVLIYHPVRESWLSSIMTNPLPHGVRSRHPVSTKRLRNAKLEKGFDMPVPPPSMRSLNSFPPAFLSARFIGHGGRRRHF